MSYKIIIVDDEPVLCQGLKKYIQNNFSDFCVVATFNKGEQAIEYIRSNVVDVVITDIKMFDISGIDLAKMIYEEFPNIRVILISGYANFDYAKDAMKYRVVDYLTKPIDFQELKNVLNQTISEIKHTEKEKKTTYNEKITLINDTFRYSKILINAFLNDNDSMLSETVEAIVTISISDECTTNDKLYLCNICDMILQGLEQNSIHIALELGKEYLAQKIISFNSVDEIRRFLVDYFYRIVDGNARFEGKRNQMIMQRAKRFIDRNYAKAISLEDVAEYVGLSPTYFSKLFRTEQEQTFINYITDIRIEHSIRLLKESECKIAEISEKVGLGCSTYFISLFKKKTGMSPNEYRKSFKKDEV